MRILLLDSEQSAIERQMDFLAGLDYVEQTEVFRKPESLLETYIQERPGMVFIRVGKPELNGLQLARKLLEIDKRAKVVFVAQNSDYAEYAHGLAVDYLIEPFDLERFLEVMARAG